MRVRSVLSRSAAMILHAPLAVLVLPLLASGFMALLAYHGYLHAIEKHGYDDTPFWIAVSGCDLGNLMLASLFWAALAGPLAHRVYHRCVGQSPSPLETLRYGWRGSSAAAGLVSTVGIVEVVCFFMSIDLAIPVRHLGPIALTSEVWLTLLSVPVVFLGALFILAIPLATIHEPGGKLSLERSWEVSVRHAIRLGGLAVLWLLVTAAALSLPSLQTARYWEAPESWSALRASPFGILLLAGLAAVVLASVALAEIRRSSEPEEITPEELEALAR